MIRHILRGVRNSVKCAVRGGVDGTPTVGYAGGWLGHRNLGDEAMYIGLQKLFPSCQFLHFDGSKASSVLMRCFPLSRVGFLAGGTLIDRREDWLHVFQESDRRIGPLVVFGTGVAQSEFWQDQPGWSSHLNEWRDLLNRCVYVGVRGPLSAATLQACGVAGVEIVGDPALAFVDTSRSEDYEQRVLGICVGQSHGNVWGTQESITRETIRVAKLASEAGWRVKWFVVWADDLEITKQMAHESGTPDDIIEVYTDPELYLKHVEHISVFVGMKLHATILAMCAYVPSIMLEYRPKCRDFMESVGQGDYTIRTDQYCGHAMWGKLLEMGADRGRLSASLRVRINALHQHQKDKALSLENRLRRMNLLPELPLPAE